MVITSLSKVTLLTRAHHLTNPYKGDGTGTPTSGSTSPAAGSAAASPAPQRRLQRVEILKIAEGTPLIDPTEVVVSQGAVLTAEPVLTPLGIPTKQLGIRPLVRQNLSFPLPHCPVLPSSFLIHLGAYLITWTRVTNRKSWSFYSILNDGLSLVVFVTLSVIWLGKTSD
jgi:hypothetical protein